jgi:hypothetical protein
MSPRGLFIGLLFVIVVGTVAFLGAATAPASTPAESSVTVPTTADQRVRDEPAWSGTALPGANPESDCTPESATALNDTHTISVTVPAGVYDTIDATFRFSITWAPVSTQVAANDLILTVVGPDGEDINSSDGGNDFETVTGLNLPSGTYTMVVCGFANTLPQPYEGKVTVTTSARGADGPVPSAPANGLAFGAATVVDPQRDEAEPLVEIDKSGKVYDCGPTGFSNASDYSLVSTDFGDQFHLLGTPPRGQQGGGGGGDCGLAFGLQPNSRGHYDYAYTGLGPLTGFVSSISPNSGQSIATGGPFANGITDEGGGADRQWMTFVDENTVLLSYNQQVPRNVVVQRSTDRGLTYGPNAALAARNPRFPGPMRYIEPSDAYPNGVVYFAWDRGGPEGNHINLSISQDRGVTWTDCFAAAAPGVATLFLTADHDSAGNIYIVYGENVRFHTYLVTLAADKLAGCNEPVAASSRLPTTDPGFSQPVQVDRDGVNSTVFQWVAAGGAPGRVAVVFAGTETDGNPNSGNFSASWDIYVNQSLNALSTDPANPPTFSQVKATTHPFHYDSICLNGLGCDLSVPPGDRSMADFFAVDYNPADRRIYVTYNRSNKKPDEDLGHVATPMVAVQVAGPSNGGGAVVTRTDRQPVRTSSADANRDALSSYSVLAPAVVPPDPPTTNERAADFLSVTVGPELDLLDNTKVENGGFTVTMKVDNLSADELLATMTRTGSQSLLWMWRFTNGYQDAAAAARWNPVQGFTFGYNDYTTGLTPCAPAGPGSAASEKCILYPGDRPIEGDVNQSTGTIRLSVPRALLRGLSGTTGPGERPGEVPASVGTRFYGGTAFSVGNTLSPDQTLQSFLYPFDNTPSFDFVLPPSDPDPIGPPCKITGSGTLSGTGGSFSLNVHVTLPPKGSVAYQDADTDFRSTSLTSATCADPSHGDIRGAGRNGTQDVTFRLQVVDGGPSAASDAFHLTLTPGGTRSGTLSDGNIKIHRR